MSASSTTSPAHPAYSRRALSIELCRQWDWKQPNGELRDMVCRGLLLTLHRAGAIECLRYARRPSRIGGRKRPEPLIPDNRPVCDAPCQRDRYRDGAPTPRSAVQQPDGQYHYLGYEQPVGEHLKYLVSAKGQAIACLAWSSSPRHLGCRDRFIGWGMEARRRNIHLLAYNTRFLILPWVTVPHLASHILGRMARQIAGDWQRLYAHPVYLLETFIDPERFRGTCIARPTG